MAYERAGDGEFLSAHMTCEERDEGQNRDEAGGEVGTEMARNYWLTMASGQPLLEVRPGRR